MRFRAFASGSNGNCIYIDNENTHILVDMGISCKRICCLLNEMGVEPSEIDGIFITHEHSDHIQGLYVFEKHYKIPLYASAETIQQIKISDTNNAIPESVYRPMEEGDILDVGDMHVTAIHTSHDAAYAFAYKVWEPANGKTVSVMTDLGTFTDKTIEFLQGLDGILLESNHDIHMLEVGPYTYALKRRILGPLGHLSNEKCSELLCKIWNSNLKFVLLGHLSEENNYPDLAYLTAKNAITELLGLSAEEELPISLAVATRYQPSDIYTI